MELSLAIGLSLTTSSWVSAEQRNVRFPPIADIRAPAHEGSMRALWGMLAAGAALSSLFLLGVQLISAGSELSYYVQLSAGVLLLVALFIAAQKGSLLLVTIAVLGSSALAASMPLDLTFSSSGLLAPGPSAFPQVGEVIERSDSNQEYLLAMAPLWIIQLILMATFAFSARQGARYRELLTGR